MRDRVVTSLAIVAMILVGCKGSSTAPSSSTPEQKREFVNAADNLAEHFSKSRLASWDINVRAGGDDCRVLVLHTRLTLEDALVEAWHYGTPGTPYAEMLGGVRRWCKQHGFRGVAYIDDTNETWAGGDARRRLTDERMPEDDSEAFAVRNLDPREADKLFGRMVICK